MIERRAAAKKDVAPEQTASVAKALVEVAHEDTIYADVYVRRARELLSTTLTRAEHQALKHIQRDIEEAVRRSKQATALQHWVEVEAAAAQADALRQKANEGAALRELGTKIYDTVGVAIDPFSPGFDFLPGAERDRGDVRDTLVERLKGLSHADQAHAPFYDARRAYFGGLALESRRADATVPKAQSIAEIRQLAAQAAERGDTARLRRYAQDILALEKKEAEASEKAGEAPRPAAAAATYQCPVDLGAPFPDDAVQRARTLGLAAARTEPLPQTRALHEYVAARIWSPGLAATRSENEGAMRAEMAVDEAGFPPDVAQPVKVLVGQFLRNPFVNSGGARYLPRFHAESALVEDFPEDGEPHADTPLLHALGLEGRRGLARVQVDDALLEHGASVLEDRLHLDPREYRLVCIPHDLYMRFGRDRGWGERQQWTHFDGYQVLRSGELRGLAGGDVRYGGLNDLLSLGLADQRASVVARFAVVRRARHVARWL